MHDARPWIQIVHVGAMHLVDASAQDWTSHRLVHRMAQRAGFAVARPMGHDPSAVRAARSLLTSMTVSDPLWRRVPTVWTPTGSATRYGDPTSHDLASATVRDLTHATAAAHALPFAGHRDATLPWSPVHWPGPPWSLASPTRRTGVQIYGADPRDPTSTTRIHALFAHHAPVEGSHALRIVCQHDVHAAVPLGTHLVLGTGTQDGDPGGTPLRWAVATAFEPLGPQELQVLRVHWSAAHPGQVAIDRHVATRPLGVGPFRLEPEGPRSRRTVITLSTP